MSEFACVVAATEPSVLSSLVLELAATGRLKGGAELERAPEPGKSLELWPSAVHERRERGDSCEAMTRCALSQHAIPG